MDVALGVNASPPLENALEWMTNSGQPVVVVGVHLQLLETIAGQRDEIRVQFPGLEFVYLRKTEEELAANLHMPTAEQTERSGGHIAGVMQGYPVVDALCIRIADYIVGGVSTRDAAARIRTMY